GEQHHQRRHQGDEHARGDAGRCHAADGGSASAPSQPDEAAGTSRRGRGPSRITMRPHRSLAGRLVLALALALSPSCAPTPPPIPAAAASAEPAAPAAPPAAGDRPALAPPKITTPMAGEPAARALGDARLVPLACQDDEA